MKEAEVKIDLAYGLAKERYAAIGVDTEGVLRRLDEISISIQCWQGDDVRGFENPDGDLTGGIQTSGNYPGRARNGDELRADLEVALAQIPGRKRINLHAIYLESATRVERDAIEPRHFARWVEWAKANDLGLDFNPTCFSHPLSEQGTLSHPDAALGGYVGRYRGCASGRPWRGVVILTDRTSTNPKCSSPIIAPAGIDRRNSVASQGRSITRTRLYFCARSRTQRGAPSRHNHIATQPTHEDDHAIPFV